MSHQPLTKEKQQSNKTSKTDRGNFVINFKHCDIKNEFKSEFGEEVKLSLIHI